MQGDWVDYYSPIVGTYSRLTSYSLIVMINWHIIQALKWEPFGCLRFKFFIVAICNLMVPILMFILYKTFYYIYIYIRIYQSEISFDFLFADGTVASSR